MTPASADTLAASSPRPITSLERSLRTGGQRSLISVFVGNHASVHGIGEILYTLYTALSSNHDVVTSPSIRPDAINVIIDEFANPLLVPALKRVKERHPKTRYVIVASEFVTDISFLGLRLGRTFNFFGGVSDWRTLVKSHLRRVLTFRHGYMHRRYLGFVEALPLCDMLLVTHSAIVEGLAKLPGDRARHLTPLVLYPEIKFDLSAKCLEGLPFGLTLSGTLTRYRRRCVRTLMNELDDLNAAVYRYTPFSQSRQLVLSRDGIAFDREMEDGEYLFNLNPPQSAKWPYSSPMRILRAALLGQIPVVTKKFDDHPIERIAQIFDAKANAISLWHKAQFEREALVQEYAHSVAGYNAVANRGNTEVLSALSALGPENNAQPAE